MSWSQSARLFYSPHHQTPAIKQIKSPDPCGGTVPTAAALVMTLLLKNYDPGTDEGRQGLARAKAWEKGVFLKEAEAAQVGGWAGGDHVALECHGITTTAFTWANKRQLADSAGQRRASSHERALPLGEIRGGLPLRAFAVCVQMYP